MEKLPKDKETSSFNNNDETSLELKAALQFAVGEILQNECNKVLILFSIDLLFVRSANENNGIPALGSTVSCLSHMTYKFSEILARDLQLFSYHSKKSVISSDEVKLIVSKYK
mmetsp:Transcript_16977/g.25097  ORF Transcript_16977/g.25097 Transcript_16977/m.25097 type:complete len:113 (+) Transcript_16977:30-368(+)